MPVTILTHRPRGRNARPCAQGPSPFLRTFERGSVMRANRRSRRLNRVARALLLAGILGASPGWALDVTWTTPSAGNWNDASNWSPGLPGAGDNVLIALTGARVSFDSTAGLSYGRMELGAPDSGAQLYNSHNALNVTDGLTVGVNTGETGSFELNGGSFNAIGGLILGEQGNGTFAHNAGTANIDWMVIAEQGGAATYILVGGVLNTFTDVYVGGSEATGGSALFRQTGGTHNNGVWIGIGRDSTREALYDLQGGTLNSGQVEIGYVYDFGDPGGWGRFEQSGGTHAVADDLVLGWDAGATGSYNLSGASVLTVAGSEWVGQAGWGTFTQAAGTHSVANDLYVDAAVASKGTFNLDGGSLDVAGSTRVGNNTGASGTFNQTGGTHGVANSLVLGAPAGATGYYNLQGGTLAVQASTVIGGEGTGTFTQDGGTFEQHGGYGALVLGSQSSASGSYTLLSGVLDVQGNEEYIGEAGSGTFTQTGGEHRFSGAMYLGTSPGGHGEYYLYGGAITNAKVDADGNPVYGGIVLGEWSATGYFFHSGGTVTVDSVELARQSGSTGHYQIDGDTASLQANFMTVGRSGTGSFVHSAGSVAIAGELNVGGDPGITGTYQMSGGTLSTQTVRVGVYGTGTFTQTGGTHSNAVEVQVAANPGSQGTYELKGGTLAAPQITVFGGGTGGDGKFIYSGGNLDANLVNYGSTEFSGGGVRVIDGDVTNKPGATMAAHSTEVQINGTLFNYGAYTSDPSINTFASLLVGELGYLVGGPGDQFRIGGWFQSMSTQNALWDTQNAQLVFLGDTDHPFSITGADLGPTTAGYDHNFGWGDFQIGGGQVFLADGNGTAGGALYVGTISGLVIADGTVTNLHGNGLNVYYEPLANPGLGGQTYALADGGSLAPVPEPGTWAMLLSGLGIIGFVAIRRMSLA